MSMQHTQRKSSRTISINLNRCGLLQKHKTARQLMFHWEDRSTGNAGHQLEGGLSQKAVTWALNTLSVHRDLYQLPITVVMYWWLIALNTK
jgi:hypothetical protein